jgi:acetylornithine deacetylase
MPWLERQRSKEREEPVVTPRSNTAPPDQHSSRFLDADVLVGWLQRLVRFPSEQSALLEKDPAIARFVRECVAPILTEIGAAYRIDKMGNLIVEIGPKSERSLLFVAYAMTHPAGGMRDPFAAARVETNAGPAVRGRGVAEQKTALAALLGALAATLDRAPPAGRLTIVVTTAGETGRHDAIDCAMQEIECRPRFAIVCVGTDNRVAIGNKGRMDFDVLVKGRACHSSVPWDGVNAISGALKAIQSVEGLQATLPRHARFGPATLTPTAVESGPKANHTVPDLVRITFDRRLLPGEDPNSVYAAIRDVIRLEPPWDVECKVGPVMYPNEVGVDGPLMRELTAAFAAADEANPEHFYCNFALDAGYFGRAGIESVMLGAGNVAQFHSDDEHVLITDLVAMARVYYRIMERCLVPGG